MNAIVAQNGHEFRQSTDAAGLCGAIVKQTAKNIQGRRFVSCEGWQAIAIAHGCAASADHVERVTDEGMTGFKATGIVRRMSDGAEIARAEGFLGDDENTWNKRPVYARRAMVQTRAISRACRSAFAHVVVMIDAGLSTTPAEEVPDGGFVEGNFTEAAPRQEVHTDPATVEDAAKPKRTNWGGRYPNKSRLHAALNDFMERFRTFTNSTDFEELLTTEEYKDFITTCEKHAPHYLEGGDPAPPEFKGLFQVEQETRDRLKTAESLPDYIERGAALVRAG